VKAHQIACAAFCGLLTVYVAWYAWRATRMLFPAYRP